MKKTVSEFLEPPEAERAETEKAINYSLVDFVAFKYYSQNRVNSFPSAQFHWGLLNEEQKAVYISRALNDYEEFLNIEREAAQHRDKEKWKPEITLKVALGKLGFNKGKGGL